MMCSECFKFYARFEIGIYDEKTASWQLRNFYANRRQLLIIEQHCAVTIVDRLLQIPQCMSKILTRMTDSNPDAYRKSGSTSHIFKLQSINKKGENILEKALDKIRGDETENRMNNEDSINFEITNGLKQKRMLSPLVSMTVYKETIQRAKQKMMLEN